MIGSPITTLNAIGTSAAAFGSAMATGNSAAAFTALVDAPAVIANGFLNGQTVVGIDLPVSLDVLGHQVVSLPVTVGIPFGGILTPPAPIEATVGPINVLNLFNLGPVTIPLSGTMIGGIVPGLVNYAPQQLAQAIGASASPEPLISLPLLTF